MAVTKANLDFWPEGWMRSDLGMLPLADRYRFRVVEREVDLGLGNRGSFLGFPCIH